VPLVLKICGARLIYIFKLDSYDSEILLTCKIMQEIFTLASEMRIKGQHFLPQDDPVARIPHGTSRMALPRVVHPAHEFFCAIRRITVLSTGRIHYFAEKCCNPSAHSKDYCIAYDSFFNIQELHWRQLKITSFP
jgi:hypothetical protein